MNNFIENMIKFFTEQEIGMAILLISAIYMLIITIVGIKILIRESEEN